MRVIFIDSDILLDVILNRAIHYSSSAKVLSLADINGFTCCTSVHSLLNIHYITKKYLDVTNANKAVSLLIEKLKIISEDKAIIDTALKSSFRDFEDAVQYFSAISIKAEIIITRNIKDYKGAFIPVLTAEQFLKTL